MQTGIYMRASIFSFKITKIGIDPKLMEPSLFLKGRIFCGTGQLEQWQLAFKDGTGSLLLQEKMLSCRHKTLSMTLVSYYYY
jgi:hypothetical protein